MGNAADTNGHVDPGYSIRFGPVQDGDVEMEGVGTDGRGASKRKSRASVDKKKSYAELESSEEDEPLVRHFLSTIYHLLRIPEFLYVVDFNG